MDLERNMVIQELNGEGGDLSIDMWLKRVHDYQALEKSLLRC